MKKRTTISNVKKTLFFSSSVIFSTLFFVIFLAIKHECLSAQNEISQLKKTHINYHNKIKSLTRKKVLLIQTVEKIALEDFGFITPSPQAVVISNEKIK